MTMQVCSNYQEGRYGHDCDTEYGKVDMAVIRTQYCHTTATALLWKVNRLLVAGADSGGSLETPFLKLATYQQTLTSCQLSLFQDLRITIDVPPTDVGHNYMEMY